MPLTHQMVTRMWKKLSDVRKNGDPWWFRTHDKTQVMIEHMEGADESLDPRKIPHCCHALFDLSVGPFFCDCLVWAIRENPLAHGARDGRAQAASGSSAASVFGTGCGASLWAPWWEYFEMSVDIKNFFDTWYAV